MRLTEELARSRGLRLPLAEAVKRQYEQAMADGWADADTAAVVELLRREPATSETG